MQRADEVSDLPGAWDGVYGYGDHNDLDAVVFKIIGMSCEPSLISISFLSTVV